jgi:aspartate carbamoyltransferase catalytic subunit
MMLSQHDLIDTQFLTLDDIETILDTARSFQEVNERTIKKLPTLRGRTVVSLFMEPSTRTKSSFEIAARRLSADIQGFSASSSSTVKGESLVDTAKTLSAMACDAVIVRARQAGTPHILSQCMDAHIINAGDGKHRHPTQALLDIFSIRERLGFDGLGGFAGLKVGIVGDIAHSRVVGSLAPLLGRLGADVTLVAPPTLMPARPDVLAPHATSDFDSVIGDLDIVYMLRIQMERLDGAPLPSLREYAMLYGIDHDRLGRLSPDAVIMHPGPINRGVELTSEAADSPKNLVLDQVSAGVCIRMAVLYLLLGGDADGSAA